MLLYSERVFKIQIKGKVKDTDSEYSEVYQRTFQHKDYKQYQISVY